MNIIFKLSSVIRCIDKIRRCTRIQIHPTQLMWAPRVPECPPTPPFSRIHQMPSSVRPSPSWEPGTPTRVTMAEPMSNRCISKGAIQNNQWATTLWTVGHPVGAGSIRVKNQVESYYPPKGSGELASNMMNHPHRTLKINLERVMKGRMILSISLWTCTQRWRTWRTNISI